LLSGPRAFAGPSAKRRLRHSRVELLAVRFRFCFTKFQVAEAAKRPLLIVTSVLAVVGSSPCDSARAKDAGASSTTCDHFKGRLAESIVAGGDKVVAPDFIIATAEGEAKPQIRYVFQNIAGMEGDMNCEMSGQFENVEMLSKFATMNAEGFRKFYRLQALAAAALCAAVDLDQNACSAEIAAIFSAARKEMQSNDLRGQADPTGDVTKDYPGGAEKHARARVEVIFRRGEIWVGLSAPK
jgi:hypothetical protein